MDLEKRGCGLNPVAGCVKASNESEDSKKRQGISFFPDQLLTLKEGLCSMELSS
jgi:hypothetical protein